MRYELTYGEVTGWGVLDTHTGGPAVIEGLWLYGLELDDADDLVDLLNAREIRRQSA